MMRNDDNNKNVTVQMQFYFIEKFINVLLAESEYIEPTDRKGW